MIQFVELLIEEGHVDHMLNGQLKPAYNIQFASSGAFIVGVMGSQKSNDLHAMIPFLTQMMPRYGMHMDKIVADAGYESIENYAYLKRHGLKSYIKPVNYEQTKKRKHWQDIGRRENMEYLPEEDAYLCKNGKKLISAKDSVKEFESGFKDIIFVYRYTECANCPHNNLCIKSRKVTSSPLRAGHSSSLRLLRFQTEVIRKHQE